MHIPENYLSPATCAVMTAAAIPAWGYSIKKVSKEITKDKMPLHIVEKKISYYDDALGKTVKPEKPNGYKFETLVLDMIQLSESCLPFEVVREKEFAPIKNPTGIDSVESARELCKACGIEL